MRQIKVDHEAYNAVNPEFFIFFVNWYRLEKREDNAIVNVGGQFGTGNYKRVYLRVLDERDPCAF